MAEFYTEKRVVITPDASALAEAVAARFLRRAQKRSSDGKLLHVSLTGGTMGAAVLAAVGRHPDRNGVDWSRVHFWWSDERFVPRGHPDRNDHLADVALFEAIEVPRENIHRIGASDDGVTLEAAAQAYAAELARFAGAHESWPSFDICFLGVGPDGHIASLFPDRPEIQVVDRAALPVRNSPKPPPERVTLTRPVINSSKRVWMVLAGTDKAAALGLALAGASYQSVPAAGAKGRVQTTFFVDQAAALQVPEQLIGGDDN